MPKAYPMELRVRVVRAYLKNDDMTFEGVGRLFDVGEATVDRWGTATARRGPWSRSRSAEVGDRTL